MSPLKPFEREILAAFLLGSDERLVTLRVQAAAVAVSKREHTGSGEYIHFAVPEALPMVVPANMVLGDVNVQVEGVQDGVAALLYVKAGRLSFLEFAAYAGEWPSDPSLIKVGYFREEPIEPNGYSLVPVAKRDPKALARALVGTGFQSVA